MPDPFTRIVSSLDYPMFVVTTSDGRERSGCLVGFATQGSIDPRRLLVGLSKNNHTYRVAQSARTLVVHVLREDQEQLARLFGEQTGDEVDKFARCTWHDGPDGVPVLDNSDWIAGRIIDRVDLGDHEGHLLDVIDAGNDHPGGRQLGYQRTKDLDAGHEA
jgi:flavin reductase (DIM6/NTAB) family NADH-FMN oxidoreductase RutF